jgi:outer membrane biosynthesis protein TonB
MKAGRAILLAILLAATLTVSGCKKKKPPVPPPQANAPTVTEPAPQPVAPPEETKPEPTVTPPETSPEPTVEKPKPKPRLRRPRIAAKKEPPKETAKEAPKPRAVVPEGSAPSGGGLSAAIPDQTATHQKFNTEQLLQATDYNLKSVTRTLTSDEQAMVQHIRSYMQQSREATQQGDTERAYNLALKAHLLSDEIVKR